MRWLCIVGVVLPGLVAFAQEGDSETVEQAPAPAEWAENLFALDSVRLDRGRAQQQIEVTLHRWGDAEEEQEFGLRVERMPHFVRRAEWVEGRAVRFEPDEFEKQVRLLLTVTEGAAEDNELVFVLRAENGAVSPQERRFVMALLFERRELLWIHAFEVVGPDGIKPRDPMPLGMQELRLWHFDHSLAEVHRRAYRKRGETEIADDPLRLLARHPHLVEHYPGAYILRVFCANENRYVYHARDDTRWGDAWPLQLAPGEVIAATILAVTEDGDVYRKTVRFRTRPDRDGLWQRTQEERQKLEDLRGLPDPEQRRRALSWGLSQHLSKISARHIMAPSPGRHLSLVREHMDMRLQEIEQDEAEGHDRGRERFGLASGVVSVCCRIGTGEAAALAERALRLAEMHVRRGPRGNLGALADLHVEMAHLAITNGFKVEKARLHLERCLEIRKGLQAMDPKGARAPHALEPERERAHWPRRFGPFQEGGELYDETSDGAGNG